MEDVGRRRLADELGNGRFVRSLLEKAGRARDVRIMADGAEPTRAELVTLEAADLEQRRAPSSPPGSAATARRRPWKAPSPNWMSWSVWSRSSARCTRSRPS